jgi:amino acid adenylation domain-containing protein
MNRLQDSVARQADSRPDAPAIVAGAQRVTYAALEMQSNQLARVLRGAGGCRQGDRVAVLMPKSPAAIMAILAIYKADCIFVPLDVSSPARRVAKILASCESRLILAAQPAEHVIDDLRRDRDIDVPPIGWLDEVAPDADSTLELRFTLKDVHRSPAARIDERNAADVPAHILFTSGSTGIPKGVVIRHRNVIDFVTWACRHFAIKASDRLSGHSPLHFDLSTFDIFGAFAAGAELHLVPADLNALPHRLADFIRSSELTQWFSVPSVLNYLAKFDAVGPNDFPSLERLMWCGEVFPTPALMYWMGRLPHVAFTNLYGPTETTIASAFHRVRDCPSDPSADVPIGTACDGEELLLLGRDRKPVPTGEIGEVYIRGAGVSSGYWNDPERTAAAFFADPLGTNPDDRLYKTGDLARIGPDGLFYFVGRADAQIKSRGYRIEPGEIESAISAIGSVQEAAVVGIPTGGFEGTVVACAFAQLPDRSVSATDLRKALSARLPGYMLPTRWMALPSLPRNASGKIDRRALRELFTANEALTA